MIEKSERQEAGEDQLSTEETDATRTESEEGDATPTETEESDATATETEESDAAATEAEESDATPAETEEPESVAEALEQAGRDVSTLAVRELQLAAARHRPAVRRALRDIVAALAIAVALLTAFAFLNVAADRALSLVMPDWAAPLVLAAAWIALGAVLFAVLLRRGEGAAGARRWRVALAADQATSVAVCEQARDDARDTMRASLGRLTDALTSAAGEQLAQAASGVAEGVVDAGEDILDAADDITEAIEEALPGGGVVSKAVDLALVPGRFAIRISRTIFVRGERPAGN